MTVKELFKLCQEKIKEGYENSEIVLCVNDDEFYLLDNQFSSPIYNSNKIYDYLEDWELKEEDVIVLN